MASIELDAIDRRILGILQENGRLSNQEIAERVNLSPSPCLRRIRRLEESGVIRGYVALLDAQKLGLDLLAYVNVRLEKRGGLAAAREGPAGRAGATHAELFRAAVQNVTNKAYWDAGFYDGLLVLNAPRTFLLSASVDF